MSVGSGRQEGLAPWILKFGIFYYILARKVVSLVSRRKNEISSLLTPPGKIFMVTCGKIR